VTLSNDHHSELDAAIGEVDRVRKLVGKIKVRQIRNAEHRDLLKATALSWFRSRRPSIAVALPADLVELIDRPYRAILDACERDAARTTFLAAATGAKSALVAARGAVLVPPTAARSGDAPPDFVPLASDPTMQAILLRRWDECRRCLDAGAPLAATVMMGGLLEALFVARANKLSDKSRLFKSHAAPIDAKTKKPLDLRQWTLAPYIDVGHDLKWISRSAKDVAAILRDYRNYVHPEKERSHGVTLTPDDALMFWEVTKTLSRELLAMKGGA
jgi:hypothetical protein